MAQLEQRHPLRSLAGDPWIPRQNLRGMTMVAAVIMSFTGCVPLDQLPAGAVPSAPSASPAAAAVYPEPEGGGVTVAGTHFTIKGYYQSEADALKALSESLYSKLGNDTGLYTFMSAGEYSIVQYRDREEYLAKTHQSSWSKGVAAGNVIYCYPDPDIEATLAHEMTHLVLRTYLGDKASSFRWLVEGLAMNQEVARMKDGDRSAYNTLKTRQLRQDRQPFSQMTFFVANSEENRRTEVWYQQVESVVTYLLSQGSPLAFTQVLSELKSGADFDRALSDSYPAKYRTLTELENLWKYTI